MIWDLDRGLQMKVQTRGLRTAVFHRAGSSDTLDRTVPTLLAVFVGHRGARPMKRTSTTKFTDFFRRRAAGVLPLPSISAMADTSESIGRDGIAHRARIRTLQLCQFRR